jgi:hypothetical protein
MTLIRIIRAQRKNRQSSIGTCESVRDVPEIVGDCVFRALECVRLHHGCHAPLAYLYLGPGMIAPGEARATSLPCAGCWDVKHGGHSARHQVSFRMWWLCTLLFQAGHSIRRSCPGRKKGRVRSACHHRGLQRERTPETNSWLHEPYVRILRLAVRVRACLQSVPRRLHQSGSRNQTIR